VIGGLWLEQAGVPLWLQPEEGSTLYTCATDVATMGNSSVKPLGNVGVIRSQLTYRYVGSTPASKLGGLEAGIAVVQKIDEMDLPKKKVHLFVTDKCFVVCTASGDTVKVLDIKNITYYFQHPHRLNIVGVFENLPGEHTTVCHCFQAKGNAKKLANALDVATLSLTTDDEERRYDGDALYTKQEFIDFYGAEGEGQWDLAPKPEGGVKLDGFSTAVSSDDFDFDDATPAERAANRAATMTSKSGAAAGIRRSNSISSAKVKLSISEREALYDSPFAKPGSLVDTFADVKYFGQVQAENNHGGVRVMKAAREKFTQSGQKAKSSTVEVYENTVKILGKKSGPYEFLVKDIGYTYEFQGEELALIILEDSVRQHVMYHLFGVPGGASGGASGFVRSLNTRKKMKSRGASGDSRMSLEPVYDAIQAFEATYYGIASYSQMSKPDDKAVQCFAAIKKRAKHAEAVFLLVTKKGLRCIGALTNEVLHSWSANAVSYFSTYQHQMVVMHRDQSTGVVDVMLLSTTSIPRAGLVKQVFQRTWFPTRGRVRTASLAKGAKGGAAAAGAPVKEGDVSQDFVASGPRTPAPESLFKRQIHRRDLMPEKVLGAGQFGKVYMAHMNAYKDMPEQKVAVKVLKDVKSNADRNEFIHEAEVMLETSHPNLVNMLGVAVQQKPWLMALDLCTYGDLQKLLKVGKMKEVSLSSAEQIHVCCEVAKGMAYMEEINFVHCDLAARNVLVGSDNQFKVADFGMTRRLRNRPRWRGHQGLKVAIRWSAVEVLDERVYTTKADIWAFGVVMWEIFAYGLLPYPGLKNAEVHRLLKSGGIMKAPPGTPKQCYEMMRATWKKDPQSRPTFKEMVTELQTMLRVSKDPAIRDIGLTIKDADAIEGVYENPR